MDDGIGSCFLLLVIGDLTLAGRRARDKSWTRRQFPVPRQDPRVVTKKGNEEL